MTAILVIGISVLLIVLVLIGVAQMGRGEPDGSGDDPGDPGL